MEKENVIQKDNEVNQTKENLLVMKEDLKTLKEINRKNKWKHFLQIMISCIPGIIGTVLTLNQPEEETVYQKEALIAEEGQLKIESLDWESKSADLEEPNLTYCSEWAPVPNEDGKYWRFFIEINDLEEVKKIINEPKESDIKITNENEIDRNPITIETAFENELEEKNNEMSSGFHGKYEYLNEEKETKIPLSEKEQMLRMQIKFGIGMLLSVLLYSKLCPTSFKRLRNTKSKILKLEEEINKLTETK